MESRLSQLSGQLTTGQLLPSTRGTSQSPAFAEGLCVCLALLHTQPHRLTLALAVTPCSRRASRERRGQHWALAGPPWASSSPRARATSSSPRNTSKLVEGPGGHSLLTVPWALSGSASAPALSHQLGQLQHCLVVVSASDPDERLWRWQHLSQVKDGQARGVESCRQPAGRDGGWEGAKL